MRKFLKRYLLFLTLTWCMFILYLFSGSAFFKPFNLLDSPFFIFILVVGIAIFFISSLLENEEKEKD